jgi:hypothetical protein
VIVEEVVHADVLLTLLLWLFFYRHGTVFPSASGRVAAQDTQHFHLAVLILRSTGPFSHCAC